MNQTDLEMLIAAVTNMRTHQRAWFGGDKSRERLQSARDAERKVDRLLADVRAGMTLAPQAELFPRSER